MIEVTLLWAGCPISVSMATGPVCRRDVSCRHQGVADIKRHEKSVSHSNQASGLASTSKLSSMGFLPVGSTVDISSTSFV